MSSPAGIPGLRVQVSLYQLLGENGGHKESGMRSYRLGLPSAVLQWVIPMGVNNARARTIMPKIIR